jgi:xanthine dehydrogenase small subunit
MTSTRDSIEFLLGAALRRLRDVDPTMTVLEWLRGPERLCGSKEGCAEGDCGACTVVLAEPWQGRLRYRAVNACILFLPELDGRQLITVEHLAGETLHPAQQAMVEHHASQCGFCTPGFVMSMFAACHTAPVADRDAVDKLLAGNLCRCTGYRPIADATLAACAQPAPDQFTAAEGLTLAALQTPRDGFLALQHGTRRYFSPGTMAELAALRLAHPDSVILAGGTDVGLWVTKQHRMLETVIAIGRVACLHDIATEDGVLRIGAGVTYTDALAALTALHPSLGAMVTRIGSVQVRNSGTLGGNIANGSPIGDMPPALIALDATLVLRRGEVQRVLPIADFFLAYRRTALQLGEFVERIDVPLLPEDAVFGVYKISKRADQDISAVCGAFRVRVQAGVVTEARIAFGGMAGIPARAAQAERALVGRVWSETSVRAAMAAMAGDFTPLSDMRASAAYRSVVARNLLLKLWLNDAA